MKSALIILLVILGIFASAILGFLIYIGNTGPETFVVTGNQIKRSHMKTIDDLQLIPPGEQIQFFYSDALVNVRRGMYFVTGKTLVLYNEEWNDPKRTVPLSDIVALETEFNDSFFEDSFLYITLVNGDAWSFPISSEQGRDRKVATHIKKHASLDIPPLR